MPHFVDDRLQLFPGARPVDGEIELRHLRKVFGIREGLCQRPAQKSDPVLWHAGGCSKGAPKGKRSRRCPQQLRPLRILHDIGREGNLLDGRLGLGAELGDHLDLAILDPVRSRRHQR